MPMTINFRGEDDVVAIRLARPIALAAAQIEEHTSPSPPLSFSRAEWALLVSSGLLYALSRAGGWRDWDDATAFRAPEVAEKDHLLIVAGLLIQGHDFGPEPYPPALARAGAAIERLVKKAAEYREMEGIQPIEQQSLVASFRGSRLWFSSHQQVLPHPGFQAPMLEQAVEETHVDVLIDLAKQGEEATFKELAQTLGVPAAKLDELWAGTVRRVKR